MKQPIKQKVGSMYFITSPVHSLNNGPHDALHATDAARQAMKNRGGCKSRLKIAYSNVDMHPKSA